MLFVNRDKIISLAELQYFGFKKEIADNFYYRECESYTILISTSSTDLFKANGVYLEFKERVMILDDLEVLYDLIKENVIIKR